MVAVVLNIADAAMGLMTAVNLIAIMLLSGTVAKLTKDYFDQQTRGVPRFNPDDFPELKGKTEYAIWLRKYTRRSLSGNCSTDAGVMGFTPVLPGPLPRFLQDEDKAAAGRCRMIPAEPAKVSRTACTQKLWHS